ncbi:MAG: threonine/serine dehydratase [Sphingomonadales bacterium]
MVTIDDIKKAAELGQGVVKQTPVLSSDALNARLGAELFIKAEPLQLTGSFKIRGAYNRLVQLSDEERARGIVAFSSGNHAQGVAKAAQLLGIKATIVMPEDAPKLKLEKTRAYGADIQLYNRETEDREQIARDIVSKSNAILVPSYDDPFIVAGQGTVGLELADFAQDRGFTFDDVIVCLGGGGLTSGMAIALHHAMPKARIWGVEPEGYDDGARSLKAGRIIELDRYPSTLCDALQTPKLGKLTFEILKQHLAGIEVVNDDEVRAAMRFAFDDLKVVVEPGGAVALAAALAGRVNIKGKRAVVVLSGGNVDPGLYANIISEGKKKEA